MRTDSIRTAVIICLLGAASFWAPVVLALIYFGRADKVLLTNGIALGLLAGCFTFLKRRTDWKFVSVWMLLGIHLSGPPLLTTALKLSGGFSVPVTQSDIVPFILSCLPPMFWFFAGNSGVPGILLAVAFLGFQAFREVRAANPMRGRTN